MTAGPAIYSSWGRINASPQSVRHAADYAAANLAPTTPYLAYGNGRSYGDTCLTNHCLVDMRSLNRIHGFDEQNGILDADAGVLLADILEAVIPEGWFLPVSPGTRYVTLGGAVANDVHGKNHHRAGSFGQHVLSFVLHRSDGSVTTCSRRENPQMFAATIGGMGLSGIISTIKVQLMRVASPDLVQETLPMAGLHEVFEGLQHSGERFDYVVAWIDSLAKGKNLGRGLLLRANHTAQISAPHIERKLLSLPIDPPFSVINGFTLKLFNSLYRWRSLSKPQTAHVPWTSFFYPLDAVNNWNLAYGPKGLRQFQCVLPRNNAEEAVRNMLELSQGAGHASFLTVLKSFGEMAPNGMLSFARPGVTLTLDFAYQGPKTDALLARLDAMTLAAGGAVNPYKDARMSADVYRASFPKWEKIMPFLDPMAGSVFSHRVGLTSHSEVQT